MGISVLVAGARTAGTHAASIYAKLGAHGGFRRTWSLASRQLSSPTDTACSAGTSAQEISVRAADLLTSSRP